ncbi:ferredoxin [bacterium]|nr:ferredoxin [bacterium]NIN92543.1 ferredoxin [bacterium]NIO18585.1 ferredoxin [bacterium]NIO73600.1 ferredoxin [bacterium]
MSKKQLDLIFPEDLVKQPVIWEMSKKFDVIFNIRRARVTETTGELVIQLDGDDETLDKAVEWLRKKGIKVKPVTHDVLE